MKDRKSLFVVVALVCLVGGFGCQSETNTTGRVEQQRSSEMTSPASPTPLPGAAQPQVAFAEQAENQLSTLSQRLDTLEARAAALPEQQREEFSQRLRSLENERQVIQERVNALKEAPIQGWETLRQSTETALNTLQTNYEQLAALMP